MDRFNWRENADKYAEWSTVTPITPFPPPHNAKHKKSETKRITMKKSNISVAGAPDNIWEYSIKSQTQVLLQQKNKYNHWAKHFKTEGN